MDNLFEYKDLDIDMELGLDDEINLDLDEINFESGNVIDLSEPTELEVQELVLDYGDNKEVTLLISDSENTVKSVSNKMDNIKFNEGKFYILPEGMEINNEEFVRKKMKIKGKRRLSKSEICGISTNFGRELIKNYLSFVKTK